MMIENGARGLSLMIHDCPEPPKQVANAISKAIAKGKLERDEQSWGTQFRDCHSKPGMGSGGCNEALVLVTPHGP